MLFRKTPGLCGGVRADLGKRKHYNQIARDDALGETPVHGVGARRGLLKNVVGRQKHRMDPAHRYGRISDQFCFEARASIEESVDVVGALIELVAAGI
jgi:hypothetical protein